MSLATRDQLLGVKSRRFKEITHPEFGISVRLRNLNEDEKSQYESASVGEKGFSRERVESRARRLIVATVVDGDGNPIFKADDAKALKEIDGAVTGWIYSEAWQHCGFAGTVEKAEKNSSATADAGSSVASP